MKNSPYKITVFIISTVSLILLILLCWTTGSFQSIVSNLSSIQTFRTIKTFFTSLISNSYFINIICALFTATLLYGFHIWYSKKQIKKDFRCNEILSGLDSGINGAVELYNASKKIKNLQTQVEEPDYLKREAHNATKFIEFYKEHSTEIELSKISLTYFNNQLLLDSLQSVFFININFKLLNILNNIKNRIPNVRDHYQKINNNVERYTANPSEFNLQELGNLGHDISYYIADLNFLAKYYQDLLEYLNFDTHSNKELYDYIIKTYSDTFFTYPLAKQNSILDKARKDIKKQRRKQAWKTFFKM